MGFLDSILKKNKIVQKEEYSLEESRTITDICLATIALSIYAAASDDEISIYEYMEADMNIASINKQYKLSDELMKEVDTLSMKHSITWDEVKHYLDALTPESLSTLQDGLENVINASEGTTEAESKVLDQFKEYVDSKE